MKENAYYYSKLLSQNEKLAYQAIYKSLVNNDKQCELPHIDSQKVSIIFENVISDHPELYYVQFNVSGSLQRRGFNEIISLSFKYNYDRERHLIDKEIKKIIDYIEGICRGKDEIEKHIAIQDYLIENVNYEINNVLNQNAASALYYHKAQCSGIAAAYKLLADSLGLYCIIANSSAIEKGVMGPHSWNIIKINNNYYHVDPTYLIGSNLERKKPYFYKYAFCSDKSFINDHVLLPIFPKCNDDSLEKLNNKTEGKNLDIIEINSLYELRNHLTEMIKKNEKSINIYFNIDMNEKQFETNLVSSVKMVANNLRVNIKSVNYQKLGKEVKITLDY